MEERTPPSEENGDTREESREHVSETSEPAAPSIGAKTKIKHVPPAERDVGKDASDTDAMGRDKRREVIGEDVGPSRTRVIMTFVVFFAIVGIVFVGLLFLVNQVDQPPDTNADKAPWSAPDVEQQPAQPIDVRQPVGAEG